MQPETQGKTGSEEVVLMSKDVHLHLDEFGHRALARFARGRIGSEAALIRTASAYYLSDRDSHRPAWRVPRFVPDVEEHDIRIELDDDTWTALDEEAGRQGVSADALAMHAVMY